MSLKDEQDLCEGVNDEEYSEQEKALFRSIEERLREDASRPYVIVPKKIKQVMVAYKIIKEATNGRGVKVTYTLNEPFVSSGCVCIIGKRSQFSNPKAFVAVSQLATNVEIFPRTDEKIQINFSFDGLAVPLG